MSLLEEYLVCVCVWGGGGDNFLTSVSSHTVQDLPSHRDLIGVHSLM